MKIYLNEKTGVFEDDKGNPVPHSVKSPSHYKTKSMECREIIRVMVEGLEPMEAVDVANIVKYLYRFKDKGGAGDLEKVIEYTEFLKEDAGL